MRKPELALFSIIYTVHRFQLRAIAGNDTKWYDLEKDERNTAYVIKWYVYFIVAHK